MICLVYSRVSTDEQARHGFSLPDQQEQGAARARALGYSDAIQITDDGISGEVLERPGLTRARELIRAGGVGHLICRDLDRLSRKLAHQLLIFDEAERAGVKIEFVSFDWEATPEGIMFLQLRGSFSQFEKAKIRERTMAGRLRKARSGGIPHWAGCYGYIYDKATGKVEINAAQAAVVRQVYSWFLGGRTVYQIVQELKAAGVTSYHASSFSQATIRRMLVKPTYAGDYIVHAEDYSGVKHNRYRAPEDRKRPRPRPAAEHITVPVPAIVSREDWQAAQEMMAARRERRPGRAIAQYMLSGLCRCGICGRQLTGMRSNTQADGRAIRYYACGARYGHNQTSPKCILPFQRAERLESRIWALIVEWMTQPEVFLAAEHQEETPDEDQIGMLERQLAELAKERARLIDLYVRDLVPKAEADPRLEEMKSRENFLSRRLAELKPKPRPSVTSTKDLAAAMAEDAARLDEADYAMKSRLAHWLIDTITITQTEIRVTPRAAAQVVRRCAK